MNKLRAILTYIGASLAIVVGLIFAFLEFRSLLTGDFTLMNIPVASLFTYLCKGLYFASIIVLSVFVIIFTAKKKDICLVLFACSIALFIGAFITLIHFEYYVSLVIILVTAILVGVTASSFFKKKANI